MSTQKKLLYDVDAWTTGGGLHGKLSLGHGGFQTRETLEPPGESLRMNLPEAPPQAQWIQMLRKRS